MKKGVFKNNIQIDEINISPLIDLVFIMLIFFIVTTVFVDERGFESNKSVPLTQIEDEKKEPISFRISKNNQIYHKDRALPISEISILVQSLCKTGKRPVIVKVEPGSKSHYAIQVMDEALRGGSSGVKLAAIN